MSFRVERDELSSPFFEGTDGGTLLIRRCPNCAQAYRPQVEGCGDSDSLRWEAAKGVGTLVSWAVDHSTPLDNSLTSLDGSKVIFGIIELDEGPWLQVPIVGCDPSSLEEGMEMRVCFIRPGGGEAIPAFAPRHVGGLT
jgi:uncharacterized OB-fold protein